MLTQGQIPSQADNQTQAQIPIQAPVAGQSQSEKNLKGIADNALFAKTNDPNYRFVNFFNLNDASQYEIGAINNTRKVNFASSMTVPGNQTIDSCKINATALYNRINKTDYSSSSNYKKDILEMTMISGKFDDVDFFLDGNTDSTDYDLKTLITDLDDPVSIELFGYIVAPVSGNYSLRIKPEFVGAFDMVVAWIQNNAESTYRISNATFNNKEKQNKPTYLAKGVFIPFRIMMNPIAPITTFPFTFSDGTNTITDFYSILGDKKKKQIVFSLTQNPNKTQSCNIYTEGDVEKYGIDNEIWETGKETLNIEVKEIKRWRLAPSVDSVGLDELGNFAAFSNNVKIGSPIILSNYSRKNDKSTSAYQLILQETTNDMIRLQRINQFIDKNTVNISTTRTTAPTMNLVRNSEWNQFNRSAMNSQDRITISDPLVSNNKRIMLVLVKENKTTSLVLYGATSSSTIFYGLNVDNKLGKTFYANQNVAKQYLREVPSEMTAYSKTSSFTSYGNYYPQVNGKYTIGKTKDCLNECNSDPNCTHTYNVTEATGTKCLLSTGQPVYATRPLNTPFTSSTLNVRGKMLDINKMTDKSFQDVKYEMGSITGFNDYTYQLPLTKDSIEGTNGEPEYIALQNKISASTSASIPLIKKDQNSQEAGIIQGFRGLVPSNLEGFGYTSTPARKIEGFSGLVPSNLEGFRYTATPAGGNIVQNISGQLLGLQGQIVDYTGLQTRVGNLARDISGNITNINTQYNELAQNNPRYDFTTSTTINALDEDYSMGPALLKDNAIYLEEQTNVKIVGTITLATILISAIFISR